jgi:hypothetical protein
VEGKTKRRNFEAVDGGGREKLEGKEIAADREW